MTHTTVHLELFGLARRLTGRREVPVDLPAGARLRDVVSALAAQEPPLVGPVIAESGQRLVDPHVFNVDGLTVQDLDRPVAAGQTICLMFIVQGG